MYSLGVFANHIQWKNNGELELAPKKKISARNIHNIISYVQHCQFTFCFVRLRLFLVDADGLVVKSTTNP